MSEHDPAEINTKRRVRHWVPIAFGLSNTLLLVLAGSALSRLARAESHPKAIEPPVQVAMGPELQLEYQPLIPDVDTVPAIPTPLVAPRPAVRGPLRGHIGPMGPMSGPFATALDPNAPVLGPEWLKNPLPSIVPGAKQAKGAQTTPLPNPKSDVSSELPDERKVALSRLANPQPQVRSAEQKPKAVEVSAEKPLSLHLALSARPSGYEIGDNVAVRVNASADCYGAIIAVDSAGHATTLFQSPAPARSFACALKVGPNPGPEYVMAVASVHPLNGAQTASVLKTAGGFSSVHPAVDGGTTPGAAWSLAVSQAAGLSGTQQKWQRFEWAVATDGFAARVPVQVAANSGPDKKSPKASRAKKPSRKPASDESVLPKVEIVSPAPVPSPDTPASTKTAPAQPAKPGGEGSSPAGSGQ